MEDLLTAFQDSNFHPRQWLNQQEDLENRLPSLLRDLTACKERVYAELDIVVDGYVHHLPHLSQSMEDVQLDIQDLDKQLTVTLDNVLSPQVDSTLLSELMQLGRVQSRMEESTLALQEAQHWTTLRADYERLLKEQAEPLHLVQLVQKRLRMLEGLNYGQAKEDDERRIAVKEVAERLVEDVLRPGLLQALSAEVEALQESLSTGSALPQSVKGEVTHQLNDWHDLFLQVRKQDLFLGLYQETTHRPLLDQWRSLLKTNQISSNMEDQCLSWLEGLYCQTARTLNHFLSIFPERPVIRTAHWLKQVWLELDPPISTLFKRVSDQQGLEAVVQLMHHLDHFFLQVEQLLSLPSAKDALDSVVEQLVPWHRSYPQLEMSYLSQEAIKVRLETPKNKNWVHSTHLMNTYVSSFMNVLERMSERCVRMNHGWAGLTLEAVVVRFVQDHAVPSLQEFLNQYLESSNDETSKQQPSRDVQNDKSLPRQKSTSQLARSGSLTQLDDELDGVETLTDPQVHLQTCFQLFQVLRSFLVRLQAFMDKLHGLYTSAASQSLTFSSQEPEAYSKVEQMSDQKRAQLMNQRLGELFTKSNAKESEPLQVDVKLEPVVVLGLRLFVHYLLVQPLNWTFATTPANVRLNSPETQLFHLSPSEYMHHVGEHLLSLPHQLETWSSAFVSTGQNQLSLIQWLSPLLYLLFRSSPVPKETSVISEEGNGVHLWMTVLSGLTIKRLRQHWIGFSSNEVDPRQLVADIEYVKNILSALGLPDDEDEGDIELQQEATITVAQESFIQEWNALLLLEHVMQYAAQNQTVGRDEWLQLAAIVRGQSKNVDSKWNDIVLCMQKTNDGQQQVLQWIDVLAGKRPPSTQSKLPQRR